MEILYLIAIVLFGIFNNRPQKSRAKSKKRFQGRKQANQWTYEFEANPDHNDVGWEEIRKNILIRDGYRCAECDFNKNLTIHHIKPLRLGGDDSPDNLITLCRSCHEKIHGRKIFTSNNGLYSEKRKLPNISRKVKIVNGAIATENSINISYTDVNGNCTRREIEPKRLYEESGLDYLRAYCKLRNDGRTFRMNRLIINI